MSSFNRHFIRTIIFQIVDRDKFNSSEQATTAFPVAYKATWVSTKTISPFPAKAKPSTDLKNKSSRDSPFDQHHIPGTDFFDHIAVNPIFFPANFTINDRHPTGRIR